MMISDIELKRDFVIERLKEKGINHLNGTSIHELSYSDLKYLLVLQAFKEIDVEVESHKWF